MAPARRVAQAFQMHGVRTSDVLIVGGGVVGASLAYGMRGRGLRIDVLDGGDGDIRAARANFGLVWVQSKGREMPAYARWTRESAELWAGFAEELAEATATPLRLRQTGGLSWCLGEAEFEARRAELLRWHNQRADDGAEVVLLERSDVERLLPGVRLGADVTGASFCASDGECDPLALLKALHLAMAREGITLHRETKALAVTHRGGVFRVDAERGAYEAPRLVLAAGLGSAALAPMVGLPSLLRPERGQILVTERIAPFLPFAGDTIRQTADGTVMIGATHEDVGLDLGVTEEAGAALARHAVAVFPGLAKARMVRTWAGLRVLTPDGNPLYAESVSCPGAALVTCHSGVTLAAAHTLRLAPALLAGPIDEAFAAFGPSRFASQAHVSQAA